MLGRVKNKYYSSCVILKKCVCSGKPWWYPCWTTFVNKKRRWKATMFCYWNKWLNNAARWFPELRYFISMQNYAYQRYLDRSLFHCFSVLQITNSCFVVLLFHKLALAHNTLCSCTAACMPETCGVGTDTLQLCKNILGHNNLWCVWCLSWSEKLIINKMRIPFLERHSINLGVNLI